MPVLRHKTRGDDLLRLRLDPPGLRHMAVGDDLAIGADQESGSGMKILQRGAFSFQRQSHIAAGVHFRLAARTLHAKPQHLAVVPIQEHVGALNQANASLVLRNDPLGRRGARDRLCGHLPQALDLRRIELPAADLPDLQFQPGCLQPDRKEAPVDDIGHARHQQHRHRHEGVQEPPRAPAHLAADDPPQLPAGLRRTGVGTCRTQRLGTLFQIQLDHTISQPLDLLGSDRQLADLMLHRLVELLALHTIADHQQEFCVGPRLFHELEQSDLIDGADDVLFLGVAGQQHTSRLRLDSPHLGKEFQPRHLGHHLIGDDQVHRMRPQVFQRLGRFLEGHCFITAFQRKMVADGRRDHRLVVQDENDRLSFCHDEPLAGRW